MSPIVHPEAVLCTRKSSDLWQPDSGLMLLFTPVGRGRTIHMIHVRSGVSCRVVLVASGWLDGFRGQSWGFNSPLHRDIPFPVLCELSSAIGRVHRKSFARTYSGPGNSWNPGPFVDVSWNGGQ